MSWLSQLYKTYEDNVGKELDPEERMTPVAHMNANAQLELILNKDGTLKEARVIDKGEGTTLIPVTEASAGRSSGAAPHALCDSLSYIAGDFSCHCGTEKQKKTAEKRFAEYMENLKMWVESPWSHPKVRAVYQYLSQKKLIADLIELGVVQIDEDGKFCDKKIGGQPYEKALVRFRILGSDPGKTGTWQDDTLIKAYTQYYFSIQNGKTDICYYIGQERTVSGNHPKGIVAANYGAKLVSANDAHGYTYRGRFQNAEQSYVLSYEASQKIHSALTWLVKKQGVYVGSRDKRMFLCWNPEGKKIPDIFESLELEEDEESTPISYRKKLRKTLQGYRDQFQDMDSVIILGLDAATTGRLSVTYYQELEASQFIDRVTHWGVTCCWYYLKFDEKKKAYFTVETPIFRRIVECAFGCERGGFLEVDDKLLKEQVQRLVKCMVEDQRIPYDLVQALKNRASVPMAYKSGTIRERVLSTACAMTVKYYQGHEKKEEGERKDMKLDVTNTDRSYLFGRLLAIYEKAERITYDRGESREPNAIRLQSAFVNHPMQTWKLLEDLLKPYFQKLKPGSREYYKNMIGEIAELFDSEDERKLNMELSEKYLLGYYLQRAELKKKEKEEKNND